MQVFRSVGIAARTAPARGCRVRKPMQRHYFGVARASISNCSHTSLIRLDSSNQPFLSRTHGMRFSTALPGEGGEGTGVKNTNVFGVGGPGTKRPGVRRKNHMKRRRISCKDEEAPQDFADNEKAARKSALKNSSEAKFSRILE